MLLERSEGSETTVMVTALITRLVAYRSLGVWKRQDLEKKYVLIDLTDVLDRMILPGCGRESFQASPGSETARDPGGEEIKAERDESKRTRRR